MTNDLGIPNNFVRVKSYEEFNFSATPMTRVLLNTMILLSELSSKSKKKRNNLKPTNN